MKTYCTKLTTASNKKIANDLLFTNLQVKRSYTGYKFAKKMLNRTNLARKKNNIIMDC